MNPLRDYTRLFRNLKAGEEMIVTNEEGVVIVRFRIRSNGSVTAYFTSGQRGTYRSRNVFAGDADHLGDASPWRYFKVTS